MNLPRALALAALCAAALTLSQTAEAQDGHTAAAGLKRLAVAVMDADGRPAYPFAVPENAKDDGYAAETSPPRQLPNWKQPEGSIPLTSIRLRLHAEGDAVRIKVSAVLDDAWPPEAPGPKYGKREQAVGTYLAREGEAVSVDLKGFGFEPLVLGVVEKKPEPELPFEPAPARAVSRVKSVEVVSFLTEGANMESARLVIRNVSHKHVVGVEVEKEGFAQTAYRGGERPLIESGGTYEMQFGPGRRDGGLEPARQEDALFVSAALFADDSYEGDAKAAAQMFARQRGRAMQLARVVMLLRGSLDTDAPDALAMFKGRVAEMRIDVAPSTLDRMLSKFPALRSDDDGRRILAESAVEGLRNARVEALRMIQDIEGALARKGAAVEPRRILEELRGQVARQVGVARE